MRNSHSTRSSICTEAGIKLTEPKEVENEFIVVFKDLMGSKANTLKDLDTSIIREGKCLTVIQQRELIKEVTTKETLDGIKTMPKEKAPGVDGFPIKLFTKNWDVIQ